MFNEKREREREKRKKTVKEISRLKKSLNLCLHIYKNNLKNKNAPNRGFVSNLLQSNFKLKQI